MTFRTAPEILGVVCEEHDTTTGDIAKRMGISGVQPHARLRKDLSRLAEAGLIERSQFMADRSSQWRRTKAGTHEFFRDAP